MRAQKAPISGQAELFRARLENLIDHNHDLVTLAERIDLAMFESRFGVQFTEGSGRPALPTHLMVGLQYLKYLYNESDENIVRRFLENPYMQYFCN